MKQAGYTLVDDPSRVRLRCAIALGVAVVAACGKAADSGSFAAPPDAQVAPASSSAVVSPAVIKDAHVGEVVCSEGSTLDGGRCFGELYCPEGTRPSTRGCVGEIRCPQGSRWDGLDCVV